jgi:hypothetical protein
MADGIHGAEVDKGKIGTIAVDIANRFASDYPVTFQVRIDVIAIVREVETTR